MISGYNVLLNENKHPDDFENMSIVVLADLHDFYFSKNYFNKDFKEVISFLLNSFNEEYGFLLDIDDKEPFYYSSVTSTVLLALYHMKMLDVSFKNKIYNSIFNLKDKTPNKIFKEKSSKDFVAWDVSESANCWTTSLVIESLLETGYSGDEIEKIKDAILWLKDKQKDDGGWGFDKNCISRVFFTARVLYALYLGKKLFHSETSERSDIETTISFGTDFIKKEIREDRNTVYWTIAKDNDKPDPTNTVMALWVLNKLNNLSEEVKRKALNYLRNELKNKEIWDFKKVIEEVDTKYGTHKIIASFTPSIPLVLLELGVSPMDELCLKPICWLKNNFNNGWKLAVYHEGIISFVYALGLWTVNKLLTKNIENNIFIRLRKRIKVGLVLILTLFLIIVKNYIVSFALLMYETFFKFYGTYGLISTVVAILTIIMAIPTVLKSTEYIDKRFLNNKLENSCKNVIEKIYGWIYVK